MVLIGGRRGAVSFFVGRALASRSLTGFGLETWLPAHAGEGKAVTVECVAGSL